MAATSLTFLAPAGALLCLTALAPLVAVLMSMRRSRRVTDALRLERGSTRGALNQPGEDQCHETVRGSAQGGCRREKDNANGEESLAPEAHRQPTRHW